MSHDGHLSSQHISGQARRGTFISRHDGDIHVNEATYEHIGSRTPNEHEARDICTHAVR